MGQASQLEEANMHVLVQKKQIKPMKLVGERLKDMRDKEWEERNELALSTIMFTLSKSVYFNMANETNSFGVWIKRVGLYEKQSEISHKLHKCIG